MKTRIIALIVVLVVALVVGCAAPEEYGDVDGGWGTKTITVTLEDLYSMQELPPSPEDIGVVGVEPRGADANLLDIDLATFWERWNEYISYLIVSSSTGRFNYGSLRITSFDLHYGKYYLELEHQWARDILIEASIDYQTGQLIHATIRFPDRRPPDIPARRWSLFESRGKYALIYATSHNPNIVDSVVGIERAGDHFFTYEGLKYIFIGNINSDVLWIEAA